VLRSPANADLDAIPILKASADDAAAATPLLQVKNDARTATLDAAGGAGARGRRWLGG